MKVLGHDVQDLGARQVHACSHVYACAFVHEWSACVYTWQEWRSFTNERVVGRESKGFLDGDLIESFLDLRRDKMEEV